LVSKAKEVRELLRPHLSVFYDEAGAIGRRYRRQDEAGTPFGVTMTSNTLGEKGPELQNTVTLRDRDSMKQERVKIGDLVSILLEKIRVMDNDTELVRETGANALCDHRHQAAKGVVVRDAGHRRLHALRQRSAGGIPAFAAAFAAEPGTEILG